MPDRFVGRQNLHVAPHLHLDPSVGSHSSSSDCVYTILSSCKSSGLFVGCTDIQTVEKSVVPVVGR